MMFAKGTGLLGLARLKEPGSESQSGKIKQRKQISKRRIVQWEEVEAATIASTTAKAFIHLTTQGSVHEYFETERVESLGVG